MIDRTKIITLLNSQLEKPSGSKLNIFQTMDWIDTDSVKQLMKDSQNGEEAYVKLGVLLCETESSFEGIAFREDCYDYLIAKGFEDKEAFELMEIIRKGQYRFEKYQIQSNRLTEDFCRWAKGVKYLPSRKLLKDMFETKTIYKEVIIEEFDKFYFKKLKKSLPSKINNGEIEWIYAYGDKLIASGSKSVFETVKKLIETKNCDNPYIESEVLYAKCQELYSKYKNKRFWFSCFK